MVSTARLSRVVSVRMTLRPKVSWLFQTAIGGGASWAMSEAQSTDCECAAAQARNEGSGGSRATRTTCWCFPSCPGGTTGAPCRTTT